MHAAQYHLGQIYEQLKSTSETATALGISMTTLESILGDSFFALLIFGTLLEMKRISDKLFCRSPRFSC